MQYKVESIGAAFTEKDIRELSKRLTDQSKHGWELDTVFQVESKGCFGMSQGNTYLAVFRKPD